MAIVGFDPNLLLSFYQAQLPVSSSPNAPSTPAASTANPSATANDAPPWQAPQLAPSAMDAKVLATTNFLDTSKVPQLLANNNFTGNQTITGNLTATGTITGGTVNATTGFDIGGSPFAFGSSTQGNVFLGFAGNFAVTGVGNTATGYTALLFNTTGNYNTANGFNAL